MIADHAENLGLMPMIDESKPGLLESEWGREVHDLVNAGEIGTVYSMWDAMKRKEVYVSTGTGLVVRVFAGWDFEPEEVDRWDFAATAYARGVPMGGDLRDAPAGQAPVLMIRALRDPDGANLDRIQVIKGWTNADGSDLPPNVVPP